MPYIMRGLEAQHGGPGMVLPVVVLSRDGLERRRLAHPSQVAAHEVLLFETEAEAEAEHASWRAQAQAKHDASMDPDRGAERDPVRAVDLIDVTIERDQNGLIKTIREVKMSPLPPRRLIDPLDPMVRD